jgi:hypothetical protein
MAPPSDRIHYGASLTLHVCVLKSVSLSLRRANAYLADVRNDLVPYRITLDVPWMRPWEQPGAGSAALLADLRARPLEAPCDRLLALADRTGTAFVSGLILPEVAGEVDAATSTHGYVVLAYTAPNPLFRRAQNAEIEEFHALLGCTRSMSPNECDHRIAEVKAATDPAVGFLPGVAPDGAYLPTRDEVNQLLAVAGPRH